MSSRTDVTLAHGGPAREARAPEDRARMEPPSPLSPGEPSPAAPRGSRRPLVLGVVAIAVLALVAIGVRRYVYGLSHVTTDNAQVEGHVIPVLAKVSGYVTAVNVSENQAVKAGDVLVRLDDREYAAKLAQSEADLAGATANAGTDHRSGQAEAQLAAARAAATQAEANADKARGDLERARSLAPRGIVSQQQLDAADAAARATAAQLAAAQKQVLAATAALQSAAARVVAARAARDQAALNVAFTRVDAPAGGVVSRKSVEVGQLVQAGQPMMAVVPLDDVWVVANLRETEIAGVDVGDPAEIHVDAYDGRRFPGHVESLSPATGARFSLLPPDNATGNYTKVVQRIPVRIRLDHAQDPAHPLRPGMSVEASIRTK
jgi:membrane fusion protein (multidrug efflux system)